MKILLHGATGRTGRAVLEYAMAEGYLVNCLVRNERKIEENKKIKVIIGNPDSVFDSVANYLVDCLRNKNLMGKKVVVSME